MQKLKILKFDVKNDNLRVDMYAAESIRIEGRCTVDINIKKDLNKSNTKVLVDNLLLKLDKEFDIGFKNNTSNNIKTWIRSNVFKIYIRKDVNNFLDAAIIKVVDDKCLIIRD